MVLQTWQPPASLDDLTPGERARTALAACGFVSWEIDGEIASAPFLEEAGSLLLLVTSKVRTQLLDEAQARVHVGPGHDLGLVSLEGRFWPVANSVADPLVREVRAWHAGCGECPGRQVTELVGLEIDRVHLEVPGRPVDHVDLDAYQLASANELLVVGIRLAEHLSADHAAEVRLATAGLLRIGEDELISVRVAWVDADGVDLEIIDGAGARRLRVSFERPVTTPAALAPAVHRWLGLVAPDAW